jgi:hypothetical protein
MDRDDDILSLLDAIDIVNKLIKQLPAYGTREEASARLYLVHAEEYLAQQYAETDKGEEE